MSTMPTSRGKTAALALLPILLLGALVAFLMSAGPKGIFPGNFPPVEDITIGAVEISGEQITLEVTNGGPSPVEIAQVLVDDAYWQFEIEPSPTIDRLGSASVKLTYPWVEGEPFEVGLVTTTGLVFSHVVDVATETPKADARFLTTFTLIGIYIGLIPVLLGMAWQPFIRRLSKAWLTFFLTFTAGVLVFLGAEALVESIEQAETLPTALGGFGVVTLGAVGSFALILAMSRAMRARKGVDARFVIALTVAAGIGLHNMGEGLAVGAAYRLGEIALGAFLVIGFAIHNVTEGVGIVAIFGERNVTLAKLALLGAIAGLPTVLGAWTGAFFFSPTLAAVFLAVAAGAIAEVVFDVMGVVKEQDSLTSMPSLLGLASGVIVMYATGVFVAA